MVGTELRALTVPDKCSASELDSKDEEEPEQNGGAMDNLVT